MIHSRRKRAFPEGIPQFRRPRNPIKVRERFPLSRGCMARFGTTSGRRRRGVGGPLCCLPQQTCSRKISCNPESLSQGGQDKGFPRHINTEFWVRSATDCIVSFGRRHSTHTTNHIMMKYVLLFLAVFAALASGLPSPQEDGMTRFRPNNIAIGPFYVPEAFCAYKCAVTCNRLAMIGTCTESMCSCYPSFVPESPIFM